MKPVIAALIALLSSPFRSRRSLEMEVVVLRHRLAALNRTVRRPKLTTADRLLWVLDFGILARLEGSPGDRPAQDRDRLA